MEVISEPRLCQAQYLDQCSAGGDPKEQRTVESSAWWRTQTKQSATSERLGTYECISSSERLGAYVTVSFGIFFSGICNIVFGRPLPSGKSFEGVYSDDHLCVGVVPRHKVA